MTYGFCSLLPAYEENEYLILVLSHYWDQIPVGARFLAQFQTGPGAHPASCTIGTEPFPGIKRPGRGADHLTPSSAEVKKE
jgi:hypothetical protein